MSRAGRRTKRHRTSKSVVDTGAEFFRLVKYRLSNQDMRSHAEFLQDMRVKQAAGRLANPATAALLDRLERSSHL